MRSVSVVLILLSALVALGTTKPTNSKPHYDLKDAPALFQKFIKDYDRHYKDAKDYFVHYYAFYDSLKLINELNGDSNGSAVFDINKFADYTEEEKKRIVEVITTVRP